MAIYGVRRGLTVAEMEAIVDALALRAGIRVIEIGCGPGAAAREVAERVGASGHVLAVDRSAKAIALLTESAAGLISAGRLTPRHVAVEEPELELQLGCDAVRSTPSSRRRPWRRQLTGIQLPWKPNGTRKGRCTVAMGPAL